VVSYESPNPGAKMRRRRTTGADINPREDRAASSYQTAKPCLPVATANLLSSGAASASRWDMPSKALYSGSITTAGSQKDCMIYRGGERRGFGHGVGRGREDPEGQGRLAMYKSGLYVDMNAIRPIIPDAAWHRLSFPRDFH